MAPVIKPIIVPTMFPPPPAEIQLSLEEVRRHPNYHLLNANSCGLQTSSRIAKGIRGVKVLN